jgi:hypothetical protein
MKETYRVFIVLITLCLPTLTFGEYHRAFSNREQNDTTWKFNFQNFLGNNFNLHVNTGIGGMRPFFASPMPAIKIGPTTWKYFSLDGNHQKEYFQFDIDLFTWNRMNQDHRDYFTISYGSIYDFSDDRVFYNYEMLIGGITRYKVGSRFSYSVKFGIFEQWKGDRGQSFSRPHFRVTRFSYAEASFSYALLKFSNKPTRRYSFDQFTGFFNPYISVGIGGDRAILMPAIGLRSGQVHAQFSAWDDLTAAGMMTFNIMVDPVELSRNEMFINRLGLGYNYFYNYSGDLFGNRNESHSLLIERSAIRRGRHWSLHLKLGAGLNKHTTWAYNFDSGKTRTTSSSTFIPMGGIGVNFHLFKLPK